MALLDRFFTLELRKMKMQKIINLSHGGMSVKEYSLRFTQLSSHAPTMVVDSRAKMKNNSWGYPILWLVNVGHLC